MWVFRRRETSRGTYIVPHFAIAWQLAMIVSLACMQPYIVMTFDRTQGREWKGYLAGRTLAYVPAWLATWFALWSLTVAVALPKVSHRQRQPLWSTASFLNGHFIGLAVLCIASISVPTYFASTIHDNAMANMATFRAGCLRNAPLYATMSPEAVDAALAELAIPLQVMLTELDRFLPFFRVAWGLWLLWIVYTWSFFVMIATTYFRSLRRNMNKVASMDGANTEQRQLRTAWKFTVMTAMLVTMTGFAYAFASLFTFAFPNLALKTSTGLQAVTMVSLFGEGVFGTFVCVLGLAQVLWGSQRDATTASNTRHQLSNRGLSNTTGAYSRSCVRDSDESQVEPTQVHVQVQTRTMVETDNGPTSVVQFELDNYSKSDFDEKL
ncbi:hypothetical protein OIV83_006067 [Microbotryomycetes sp. JL201]|nr:hypothetical protein OIV83_006067 [Microbotryomycetes sp. JL201]